LSTRLNQTELERCNYEIDHLKKHLSNLEKKHDDLDKVIERANFEKINPNVEKEREKLIDSSETEIYCVTCGQICSERHALKHMEKCFNKVVKNYSYLFLTCLIFDFNHTKDGWIHSKIRGNLELLPEFLGLKLVLRFMFSSKLLSCDPYYGQLCITHNQN
jgi:virulence-associated protein VapD